MGIMVGRGTSPVTFDTNKFQKRLEIIAREFGEKKEIKKKMDLTFYNALEKPAAEESESSKSKPLENKTLEIIPKKQIPEEETIAIPDIIPLKTSRKTLTFKQVTRNTLADEEADSLSKKEQGEYTIQVAAYNQFGDAVSQMATLKKKGFSSYWVKGQKQGKTWYRIRIGFFQTHDDAEKIKEKLNKANIKAMIIKRDNDEDNN